MEYWQEQILSGMKKIAEGCALANGAHDCEKCPFEPCCSELRGEKWLDAVLYRYCATHNVPHVRPNNTPYF